MLNQNKEIINKHLKTHTERSDDDRSAVSVLETFLRSNGKINTAFASDDKWPNHDGTFEYVENPELSRQPKQTFYVQIKGTSEYEENDGIVKYCLKNLAFPAFVDCNVSLDPGILFVVLKPKERGFERVFWKYMSVDFLNSINFSNNSLTINFDPEDEILNTNESIFDFCEKINSITKQHSFVNKLDSKNYTRDDVEQIIRRRNRDISECIERFELYGDSRDEVSQRMLVFLDDLCSAVLLLNTVNDGFESASLQLAWERSLLDIRTKFLCAFLKGLRYIGIRVPQEGQSERLMLKYYDFLWNIRKLLSEKYNINILENLEKFPLKKENKSDIDYYNIVATAINSIDCSKFHTLHKSRYYIQKKKTFYVGKKRYFEFTLQLAGVYASKFNRITAYTKEDISSSYTIQIGYADVDVKMWDINLQIKVITNWVVSIDPSCLNKMAKILNIHTKLSSSYGEYRTLMSFFRKTGMNLVELIDMRDEGFYEIIEKIYKDTPTCIYKEVLLKLKEKYSKSSKIYGRNVIRYLLLELREETLDDVMPKGYSRKLLCSDLLLSNRCRPFEENPFISNLIGRKTSDISHINLIFDITSAEEFNKAKPYIKLKNQIKETGEIYIQLPKNYDENSIQKFNNSLDAWERQNGYAISLSDGFASIITYERSTILILNKLKQLSIIENKGQKEYNNAFLKLNPMSDVDELKKRAVQEAFVKSRLLLIYGAAGTGKTTLINYVSNLMKDRRKLFLTKTHTALQNLKRRIENPGENGDFISIDSFTKRVSLPDYDVIFVDECSTIDNRTMLNFLCKIKSDSFLIMAGDIHQIESIDFGNWFFYAKDIIKTPGANVELLSTWRTKNEALIRLWDEVRNKRQLITEMLVIDGPFSEDITSNILKRCEDDEVVLCLNYDGKFGLNNMNNYFQAANKEGKEVIWEDWKYKTGDPILFNDSKRFNLLYNNLKGKIVDINRSENSISFTVDVDIPLTESDCQKDGLTFIDAYEGKTRIQFEVYSFENEDEDSNEYKRIQSVVPFQLAYAVSIHKAQGLEYDSVKVIIPSSNSEKITHGVFYTAITRAKKHLKIYWDTETMKEIVSGFTKNVREGKSMEIIKTKLN